MGTVFNQILSVFQGFLSKAFWFGNFLPLVIVGSIHVLIAGAEYPDIVVPNRWLDNVTYLATAFVLLVVLAYALAPLIPLFRGVLDGRLLWTWLSEELRRERLVDARRIRDGLAAANELAEDLEWFSRNRTEWFDAASEHGDKLLREVTDAAGIEATERAAGELAALVLAVGSPRAEAARSAFGAMLDVLWDPEDVKLIAIAGRAIEQLAAHASSARLPTSNQAGEAFDRMLDALERNPSNSDDDESQDLVELRSRLEELLDEAADEARYQFVALSLRYDGRFALDNPQATRMGDARLITERYSLNAYRAEFDYMWSRLQLVLPDQSPFRDQLLAAKAQLDFAVLSLVLMLTVPGVWLLWLASTAGSHWIFLTVGLATPLVLSFFYRLAVEAQFGFGETMKAAIDRYRLELLKTLHQPLPPTLSLERALWQQLYQTTRPANTVDLTYRHPPPERK